MCRHRVHAGGEEVALTVVAFQGAKLRQVGGVFHAFSNDVHVQAVAQRDDGAHNLFVLFR